MRDSIHLQSFLVLYKEEKSTHLYTITLGRTVMQKHADQQTDAKIPSDDVWIIFCLCSEYICFNFLPFLPTVMKEPMEIFHHEDSEFHYVGRRIVRDTEVDVWIGEIKRRILSSAISGFSSTVSPYTVHTCIFVHGRLSPDTIF